MEFKSVRSCSSVAVVSSSQHEAQARQCGRGATAQLSEEVAAPYGASNLWQFGRMDMRHTFLDGASVFNRPHQQTSCHKQPAPGNGLQIVVKATLRLSWQRCGRLRCANQRPVWPGDHGAHGRICYTLDLHIVDVLQTHPLFQAQCRTTL